MLRDVAARASVIRLTWGKAEGGSGVAATGVGAGGGSSLALTSSGAGVGVALGTGRGEAVGRAVGLGAGRGCSVGGAAGAWQDVRIRIESASWAGCLMSCSGQDLAATGPGVGSGRALPAPGRCRRSVCTSLGRICL